MVIRHFEATATHQTAGLSDVVDWIPVNDARFQTIKDWVSGRQEYWDEEFCPLNVGELRSGYFMILAGRHGVEAVGWQLDLLGEIGQNFLSSMQVSSKEQKLTTVQQALERYTDLIRGFHEVEQIYLVEDAEGATLWTIIKAPAFEFGPRKRIYEAQITVERASASPLVDFRLLNVNEMDEGPDAAVPPTGRLLWKR